MTNSKLSALIFTGFIQKHALQKVNVNTARIFIRNHWSYKL